MYPENSIHVQGGKKKRRRKEEEEKPLSHITSLLISRSSGPRVFYHIIMTLYCTLSILATPDACNSLLSLHTRASTCNRYPAARMEKDFGELYHKAGAESGACLSVYLPQQN